MGKNEKKKCEKVTVVSENKKRKGHFFIKIIGVIQKKQTLVYFTGRRLDNKKEPILRMVLFFIP
jgi:hypothetical protein